jgi:hypothetical protein
MVHVTNIHVNFTVAVNWVQGLEETDNGVTLCFREVGDTSHKVSPHADCVYRC